MNERPEFEQGPSAESDSEKLKSLPKFGFAKLEADPLNVSGAYLAIFPFEGGETTIRISLHDSTGDDLVITHMTTKPDERAGEGHGSEAIAQLITWAKENNLKTIRATQIRDHVKSFWEKQGFALDPDHDHTKDYTFTIEE